MSVRLAACSTLLIAALSSCANTEPAPGWEPVPTASVIPVTSMVTPHGDHSERDPLVKHVTAVLRGDDVHDDVWRRPSKGADVIRVDCKATKSIGTMLLYERVVPSEPRIRQFGISGTTSLHFQWRHSDVEPPGEKYDRIRPERIAMRTRTGGRFFLEAIRLEEQDKVNGTWTIAVKREGVLLYEERFLLEGCDDPRDAERADDQLSNSGD